MHVYMHVCKAHVHMRQYTRNSHAIIFFFQVTGAQTNPMRDPHALFRFPEDEKEGWLLRPLVYSPLHFFLYPTVERLISGSFAGSLNANLVKQMPFGTGPLAADRRHVWACCVRSIVPLPAEILKSSI
jgi:hypothetical protein